MSTPYFEIKAQGPGECPGRTRVTISRLGNELADREVDLVDRDDRAGVAGDLVRPYREYFPDEPMPDDVLEQIDRQFLALATTRGAPDAEEVHVEKSAKKVKAKKVKAEEVIPDCVDWLRL